MSDFAIKDSEGYALEPQRPEMGGPPHMAAIILFVGLLAGGVLYAVLGLNNDINIAGGEPLATGVFILLGIALLIALGFEFVNGFHDTANAVATVIYTHTMPAPLAVVWSGCFNLFGVLTSSGTVAFTIVSLLPVELILRVGSGAGIAMIFSLLIAAIIWNLGTWSLGLPASSSHTLVGSIIGVGLANQMLAGTGASGVDWNSAVGVFKALLISPLVGFFASALLLLISKKLIRAPELYKSPEGNKPPPPWVRGLLVLTCTGVSFAHGSNDGQKGMGLIMLILIGTLPTAYALNHTMPDSSTPAFIQSMNNANKVFQAHAAGTAAPTPIDARATVEKALASRDMNGPALQASLGMLAQDISQQVSQSGAVKKVPAARVQNVRNEMYLASEAAKRLLTANTYAGADKAAVTSFRGSLEAGTRFIPLWVKVSVAIALGLGTMVGWKRIVVTVGERIGKTHLSYGQGASAELVAAATIMAADQFGLPVSTTHVLSSGVAGTMAANGSGLQWGTLRSIALAWVLTLPAAAAISGVLFAVLRAVF
jgi:PiT family inorganic phosphate transporter